MTTLPTVSASRPARRSRILANGGVLRLLSYALLLLAAAISLIPVIWTVLSSLKTNDTIFIVPVQWLPTSLNWNNYPDAFSSAPFGRYFLNSTVVAVAVTFTTVFFGAMAGY